jgi:hypothetical protein
MLAFLVIIAIRRIRPWQRGAVQARFEKAWARADIQLAASCLCVKGARADQPAN